MTSNIKTIRNEKSIIHNCDIVECLRFFDAVNNSISKTKIQVVSFVGFSGDYQNSELPKIYFDDFIEKHELNPKNCIINIGATEGGIGILYKYAKELGYQTTGIVSSLVNERKELLSKDCGDIFIINDLTWGGFLSNCHAAGRPTKVLSPTSSAMICVSSALCAIGGGQIAMTEYCVARDSGIDVTFYAAEMKHDPRSSNKDFRGPLQKRLENEQRNSKLKKIAFGSIIVIFGGLYLFKAIQKD